MNMALAMDMDAQKAELCYERRFLDDASNVGERLGALSADIKVDDDGDAWISLDMDLWPEIKEAPEAEAIAKMLWLEIDWSMTSGTFPFAWPGIGEHAEKQQRTLKWYRTPIAGRSLTKAPSNLGNRGRLPTV